MSRNKKKECYESFLNQFFKRSSKRLHRNQINALEQTIAELKRNPLLGEMKIGDLAGVRVYKFRITNQLYLLAYLHKTNPEPSIILLNLGSHENFHSNLKN